MQHEVSTELQLIEPDHTPDGWRQYAPDPEVRVSCTCGFDTGWTDRDTARAAAADHCREHGIPLEVDEQQPVAA